MKKADFFIFSDKFPIRILFLVIVFVLLGINNLNAVNRIASVTGDWSNASIWGGTIPSPTDDVIINGGVTVTVTANASCASITFNNSSGASSYLIFADAYTLTVSGNISMSRSGTNNRYRAINVNTGTLTAGSLVMNATTGSRYNDINITTGSATFGNTTTNGAACRFNISDAGSLTFNGTTTWTAAPTLTTIAGSTVTYSLGGAQTVLNVNYAGNLTLSGSGTKTLSAGTTTIGGNLTIDNATTTAPTGLTIGGDVILNNNFNFTAGNNTHNVAGNWTVNGWGTFTSTGNTINFTGNSTSINGSSTNPRTFNNITINKTDGQTLSIGGSATTLTVGGSFTETTGNFTAPATMTVAGNTTLSSGTFTAGSSLGITGDLTIASNTYIAGTTLTLSGNFTRNGGAFTPGTGKVTMNGSSKTLGGSLSTAFNDLEIGNTASISLGIDQNVNGMLTLSNGVLSIGNNNLTLGPSSPAIAGSFYSGCMIATTGSGSLRKVFTANGSYNFPIGDQTGTAEYSPITLNFTAGSYAANAYVGVNVTDAKHPNNYCTTNYLTRYWSISQSGITSYSYNITGAYIYAGDVVGQESLQNTALYTGTLPWVAFGALSGGTIAANGVTSVGDFTALSTSIVTGSISGSPFTAGVNISVPFYTTGAFNAGNVFTAQLSDASGSFTTPISLGTLTGNGSGTISGTIPPATLTGSGYRVRVVSSDPVFTGQDNGSNLTINNPAALSTSVTTLSSFNYVLNGGSSPAQSFTVGGTGLNTDITITPPTDFEISLSPNSGFQSTAITLSPTTGIVTSTTIYVRLKAGLTVNSYSENIVISSTAATSINISLTGAVVSYCTSTGDIQDQSGITLVSINTLSNSTPTKSAAYTDFTSQSTNLMVGSTYTLSVNLNTGGAYSEYSTAFIDWNIDGDFNDTGETLTLGYSNNQTNGATSLSPLSITVPNNATVGTSRLRICAKYNVVNTDPCATGISYGEVEDYSINIIPYVAPITVESTAGTATAKYTSLKAAFDKINDGTHQGTITVKVDEGTNETATAALNASGTGSAIYSSINIYPTKTGLTIGGSTATPIIQLNGANNVTLDGRVNLSGSADLTISNTSTANGARTIEFINSAQSNTLQYCKIKGAGASLTQGTINFSTSTSGNGNDGNIIAYCNISGLNGTQRAANAIYSAGTATKENSSITIRNNNIFDFLSPSLASNGISIAGNSTAFTINNNIFYETTSFAPTADVEYAAIRINNSAGNDFLITNNSIGGNGSSGNWTKTNSANNIFSGIYINGGTTNNSVQGNTISNFTYANSGAANWYGINVNGGAINVGTVTGNTIGAITGTASITVTAGATNASIIGINIESTSNVSCTNNTIAAFTASTSSTNYAVNFYGIYKSGVAGTTTISNNIIGSETTANSLNASSTTTGNQILYGIYSLGTAATTISGNTIANLINNSTESAGASRLRGIFVNAGSNTIINNIVHDLTTTGLSSGNNYVNASLIGISLISNTAGTTQNITKNTIYNLGTTNNTNKIEIYGIYFDGPDANESIISKNFVHSFNIPLSANGIGSYLHGISLYNGAYTVSNNIIYLGANISLGCSIWGLWTNSNDNIKIYYNTIYLSGTATNGTSNSFAFRALQCPASIDLKNNILWDGRSNSSGTISHFAIYLNCNNAGTTNVNYNNYQYAQQFGSINNTTYNTFALWKSGTSLDANSLNVDPLLVKLGGTLPIDYQSSIQMQGVAIPAVLTDFDGITRVTPTMGAWEYFANPVEIWKNSTLQNSYSTLKGAFDVINAGTYTGDLTIKIRGNTTETATATLNASGTGLASYSHLLIYPARSGVTVSGNLPTAPVVNLNGAQHVVFDGRVDGTGNAYEFSILNTSTSNTAETSTIRFGSSAQNDTIRYCVVKGSSTATVGGNIYFGASTSGTGNSYNVISTNKITSSTLGRPVNAIYSAGTASFENRNNIIQNNEFYDFLNAGLTSYGVNIGANSTDFIVSGNSFYETTSFAPSLNNAYNIINIANTSGNNFVVQNNYIGGNSALAAGTWTKTNSNNNPFYAINLGVGITTASSIQGNIIRNFSYSNNANADWYGINIGSGAANVGTITGNTIGASTGNGSITLTNATTGGNFYGINLSSTGTLDVENNNIGAITTSNGATLATNIYGINKAAGAGTTTISKNTIGSTTTSNSIQAASTSTGNAQTVYAIASAGTGAITINGNTIANLTNSSNNTNTGTRGRINGIWSSAGSANTISDNLIYNLSIANANNAVTYESSNIGINISGTGASVISSNNTIYNLTNTYGTFAGAVAGIFFNGTTAATNTSSRNFIYNISSTSTAASIYGIYINTGVTIYSNNIISLGSNSTGNTIYGIYDLGNWSHDSKLYFNTVYISGNGGTNPSYALYNYSSSSARDYKNNLLHNARSRTATASHYAIFYNSTGNWNLTADFNNYVANGTGGVIAYYGGAQATIAALRTANSRDAASINTAPAYAVIPGSTTSDYKPGVTLVGTSGTGISIDYASYSRPSANPTIGAWERFSNKWKGTNGTDWNTNSNWTGNLVPDADATIEFDPAPVNHCVMDQNRSVNNIINAQGTYRVVTNGSKLTVKGNLQFTNGAQIDASSTNSTVEFAGTATQSIPSGAFFNNNIYNLTVNNPNNLTLNGTLNLLNTITTTNGNLDAYTALPNLSYSGSTLQSIDDNIFLDNTIHNLTINNTVRVNLNTDITLNNNLSINSNCNLTILPTKSLYVSGSISNQAGIYGLYIQASATEANGSLTFFNSSSAPVLATVEMYSKASWDLTAPSDQKYKWQFFGIPLESLTAVNSFTAAYVRKKIESGTTLANHWVLQTDQSELLPFVGYEVCQQAPKIYQFAGQLVNRNYNSGQLTVTTGGLYPGQYLFTNPYTAAIDIRQLDFGSDMDATVYMYNAGTYAQWNSGAADKIGDSEGQYTSVPKNNAGVGSIPRQVPSMGSMLVKTTTTTSTANTYFNIQYNAVITKNTDRQRVKGRALETTKTNKACTTIEVEGKLAKDKMWIITDAQDTRDYSNGNDGRKILGSALLPQIFAMEKDGNYQVNAVDDMNNTYLGFQAGQDTEYTLKFTYENSEGLYSKIYLHDLITNAITDITESRASYSFNAESTPEPVQRFRIFTKEPDKSLDNETGLRIFSIDRTLYVQNFSNIAGAFSVYDLAGRKVGTETVGAGGIGAVSVNAQSSYIVKYTSTNEVITKKIIIN